MASSGATDLEAARSALQQARQSLSSLEEQPSQPLWWSTTNAMTISSAVLAYSLVVLLLATFLIKGGKSAESVLRFFGTILIITTSVFLVVAGYSSNQIAPVTGLLGTLAGYLLGKGQSAGPRDDGPGNGG
jgi:hypothetical protein